MIRKSGMSMWQKILLGLVLGVVVGVFFGPETAVLKPLGDIFIALIRMAVIPVVFVSLVCGVTAMEDVSKIGRVAFKSLFIYIATMALASTLAMGFASMIHLGQGVNLAMGGEVETIPHTSMIDTLMGIFPSNPFQAFAEGKILPTIVFAMFIGMSINLTDKKHSAPIKAFFENFNAVIFKLITIVLGFSPIGVFGLMAYTTGVNGIGVVEQLAELVATIWGSHFFIIFVVYSLLLMVFGLSPLPFMRKMFPVQLFAFSSTSSSATLPLNLENAEHQLGVPNEVASFVLPLGSTVNMNGLSAYLGVVAIFASNAYGIELSLTQMATVVLTTSLAAIGAAGVPGTGVVVMSLVLATVGIPLEIIGAIAAVDRIIDMMSTTTNVTGDALASVLVAKTENELDLEVYNNTSSENIARQELANV